MTSRKITTRASTSRSNFLTLSSCLINDYSDDVIGIRAGADDDQTRLVSAVRDGQTDICI